MNKEQATLIANDILKKSKTKLDKDVFNAYVRNVEYWGNRQEQDLIHAEQIAGNVEKEMKKIYKQTINNLKLQIKAIYADYLGEEEISLATMNKKLTAKQLAEFRRSLENYYEELDAIEPDSKYATKVKQLKQRVQITRLEMLKESVEAELRVLQLKEQQLTQQALEQVVEDTHNSLYESLGVGVSFDKVSPDFLRQVINTSIQGKNFKQREGVNMDNLVAKTKMILTQSFAKGEGVTKLSMLLDKQTGIGYKNAVRLVRTEVNRCCNITAYKNLKETKITTHYQYLATLDTRTSDICIEMNENIYRWEEGVVGATIPPLHPNCRSTITPYFPPDDFDVYLAPLTPQGYTKEQIQRMGIKIK